MGQVLQSTRKELPCGILFSLSTKENTSFRKEGDPHLREHIHAQQVKSASLGISIYAVEKVTIILPVNFDKSYIAASAEEQMDLPR